jgi:hypothetical protein
MKNEGILPGLYSFMKRWKGQNQSRGKPHSMLNNDRASENKAEFCPSAVCLTEWMTT